MKIILSHICICLLLVCVTYNGLCNESEWDVGNSIESGIETKPERMPNPFIAGVLAIFPGAFIHGAGHFYVGDYFTGGMLLGSELVVGSISFYTIFTSSRCGENDLCNEEIIWYVFFFGTWLYDIIGAPVKAYKIREKYSKKLSLDIGFVPLVSLNHEQMPIKDIKVLTPDLKSGLVFLKGEF